VELDSPEWAELGEGNNMLEAAVEGIKLGTNIMVTFADEGMLDFMTNWVLQVQSPSKNIPISWRSIGHKARIFRFPGILLVTKQEYSRSIRFPSYDPLLPLAESSPLLQTLHRHLV
jgi:hypothetical protein